MSLKGDLKNVQLADLFQTLSQNRQEGVLTIRAGEQSRRLQFSTAGIAILDPDVAGRRRLGEILLSAGLVTEEELHAALREQSKTPGYLGRILVDQGKLDAEDLERLLRVQVEEDIYQLFRAESGSFEFLEGEPGQSDLPDLVPFHVDGIVLEAARRMDEWRMIHEQIPELDRVYVRTAAEDHQSEESAEPEGNEDGVDAEAEIVLDKLDGIRTVQETADSLLCSPFAVAKVLSSLVTRGQAREVTEDELLTAVQRCLSRNEKVRARRLLDSLHARDSRRGKYLLEVAQLYRAAEDPKAAAKVRLRLARIERDAENPERAYLHLEEAYRDWPDSVGVLGRLVDTARELNDREDEQRFLGELAQAHEKGGENDAAIRCLRRIVELAPGDHEARRRLVNCCLKAQLKESAIQVLEDEVRILKRAGRGRDLPATYKRMLGIDPGRSDIRRALVKTQRSRRDRVLGILAWTTALVVVLGAATWYWSQQRQRSSGTERIEKVQVQIREGDWVGARTELTGILDEIPFEDLISRASVLLEKVDAHLLEKTRQERLEVERRLDGRLAGVQRDLVEQKFAAVLETLTGMLREEKSPVLRDRIRIRLRASAQAFVNHVAAAKTRADQFETPEKDSAVAAAYESILRLFPPGTEAEISAVRAIASASLEEFDQGTRAALVMVIDTTEIWDSSFREIQADRAELEVRHGRLQTLRRLSGDFAAAVQAEERGDFEIALELYRRVVQQYGEGELEGLLEQRIQRLVDILGLVEEIPALTGPDEVSACRERILAMLEEYGDLPLAGILPMPAYLDSRPPGARVTSSSGELLGITPVVVSCRAGEECLVTVSLDGYEDAEIELAGREDAEIQVPLQLAQALALHLDATFESAPVVHEGKLFVADRDGRLWRIDPHTQEGVTRFETGSLGGSRTRPVPTPRGVVLTAVEGRIWLLDTSTATMTARWEVELPEEIHHEPVLHDDELVVVTHSGRLFGIALENGAIRWEAGLEGSRPVARGTLLGSRLLLPVQGGQILGLELGTRKLAPFARIDADLFGPVVAAGKTLIATSVTGTVFALDHDSGQVLWTVRTGDLPRAAPVVNGSFLDVPLGNRVVRIDLVGKQLATVFGPGIPVAGAPVSDGSRLWLGGTDGGLYEFRPDVEEPISRTALGSSSLVGSPVLLEDRFAVVGEDGSLFLFPALSSPQLDSGRCAAVDLPSDKVQTLPPPSRHAGLFLRRMARRVGGNPPP